jgi:prevent-host-death family protein
VKTQIRRYARRRAEIRDRLGRKKVNEYVDAVFETRDQITIMKTGSPAAVLADIDEWGSIQKARSTGSPTQASPSQSPSPRPTSPWAGPTAANGHDVDFILRSLRVWPQPWALCMLELPNIMLLRCIRTDGRLVRARCRADLHHSDDLKRCGMSPRPTGLRPALAAPT